MYLHYNNDCWGPWKINTLNEGLNTNINKVGGIFQRAGGGVGGSTHFIKITNFVPKNKYRSTNKSMLPIVTTIHPLNLKNNSAMISVHKIFQTLLSLIPLK